jgi:hypothetical protein
MSKLEFCFSIERPGRMKYIYYRNDDRLMSYIHAHFNNTEEILAFVRTSVPGDIIKTKNRGNRTVYIKRR